ncbi:precorrin-6y C5,15-methyltransferase (decarboxylating) subunit CbiE [Halosegnis longus]|uniref:Precorrin-6y C5,15-methyltransferase (Decarboxylating) subunit CbiE n=1 Tax=Halosegnis longus TaxID=2216012 RepID=A0AAJ4R8F0_9EURY|nr:precorrin-6y C5,15-methyltransferase (decarboxylating) subunit CbiE [Halosegnis longus]RNJ26051.1 precorrin-6y C5,15-methyltransferase (decarboxylating) subunit CbiE [Salella cibi]
MGERDFDTGQRVPVVGIGPGSDDYLTVGGRRVLRTADVVVGFTTVLDCVDEHVGERLDCSYDDQTERLAEFGERVRDGELGVAVAMGDPNCSGGQFVDRVRAAVGEVRVCPGVSSTQVAAARAGVAYDEAAIESLHKRGDCAAERDRLRAALPERALIVLPLPWQTMPEDIARDLLASHPEAGDRRAVVCESVTLPGETLTRTTLAELADGADGESAFSDLSVLVVQPP